MPPGNVLEPPHTLQPSFWYKNHVNYGACKINPSVTERFHSLEGDYEVLANYRNCIKVFPKNVSAQGQSKLFPRRNIRGYRAFLFFCLLSILQQYRFTLKLFIWMHLNWLLSVYFYHRELWCIIVTQAVLPGWKRSDKMQILFPEWRMQAFP